MTKVIRPITSFFGGISPHTKDGLPGSGLLVKNLDIYSDSDSVTLNARTVLNSADVVVGLVKWIVDASPYTSERWGYDDAGNLYTSDGSSWTLERGGGTIGNDAAGQGLEVFEDAVYYATSDTIGRGIPLSGTPSFDDDFLTNGVDNVDNSQDLSGQTYTTPTSISETDANKLEFTPTHDPIVTLTLIFGTRGTGDVTVTFHDANDNVVASETVANASLPASGTYDFVLDPVWRPFLGNEYHFHVTSTVADATIQTGTTADLSTAYYILLFGILLANDEFHPIIKHTNGVTGTIVIGNNDYMAVWDGNSYSPNEIRIEPGFSIRGWARENEFIVAYATKKDQGADEESKFYYWDGISPYYNYSKSVMGGSVQAVVNSKNRLLSVLGKEGNITIGSEPFLIVQPTPNLARAKSVIILPGGVSSYQNRTTLGLSSADDDDFPAGVYLFGNETDRALSAEAVSSEVLTLGYTISTGSADSDVTIGAVFGSGDDLYIAWQDDTAYGVDKVSRSGSPFAAGSWESLIIDEGVYGSATIHQPQKAKEALTLTISCVALPSGCTITPKYKIDRGSSWTLGTAAQIATEGDTIALMSINQRYKEIQVGFDLVATTNYPIITGVLLAYDSLEGERVEGTR